MNVRRDLWSVRRICRSWAVVVGWQAGRDLGRAVGESVCDSWPWPAGRRRDVVLRLAKKLCAGTLPGRPGSAGITLARSGA